MAVVGGGEVAADAEGDFGFEDAGDEGVAGDFGGGVEDHAVEEGSEDHVAVDDGGFPGDGGLEVARPALPVDAAAVGGGVRAAGLGDRGQGQSVGGGGVEEVGGFGDLGVGQCGHVRVLTAREGGGVAGRIGCAHHE